MKKALLVLGLCSLTSQATSSSITYTGRCGLGTPAINIVLSSDPTAQIDCTMQNGDAFLLMKSNVTLTVGSETYTLGGQWDSFQSNCTDALNSFKSGPWFPTTDAASGGKVTVILNTNAIDLALKSASGAVSMGCTGKIPGT